MQSNNWESLDEFTRAYAECALWSSTDGDKPLDEDYGIEDIAPECLAQMIKDCADFREANKYLSNSDRPIEGEFWTDSQAGHDFWLSRNGHGCGFYDRFSTGPMAELGDQLQEAARVYGSVDLYVGDDGLIYS